MKYLEQESSTVEFKAEIPKNDQLIKTLVGFCNQNGGEIVLGVDDDGTICGIDPDEVEDLKDRLDRAIFQACSPTIIPKIYTQGIADKTVMVIKVSAGMSPPYYRTSEGIEKGVYIRLGSSTHRATSQIIHELHLRARGRSYDSTPVYQADEEDLDMKRIESFLEKRKGDSEVELGDAVLRAYRIVVEEHGKNYPSVGGMLLFGKDPNYYFTEAMIICTHFRGISGRDVIATRDAEGSLFEQVEKAYDFVLSCLNRSFTITGKQLQRIEEWEMPVKAIREMIINMVLHRNYQFSSPSKIAIYEDRIEIFSPGQFPGPLNKDQLTLGLSFIRNNTMAKIFREAGYIEKLGSGFTTLFNSFQERGLEKPQVIEGPGFIKVILPRYSDGGEKVDEILSLLTAATEISAQEIMTSLRISRATATRRIKVLIEKGLVKKLGKGRAVRYVKIRN